jgi:hypothetical protein
MLYSGAKGTVTPNNRLQQTALRRRRCIGTLACPTPDIRDRQVGVKSANW